MEMNCEWSVCSGTATLQLWLNFGQILAGIGHQNWGNTSEKELMEHGTCVLFSNFVYIKEIICQFKCQCPGVLYIQQNTIKLQKLECWQWLTKCFKVNNIELDIFVFKLFNWFMILDSGWTSVHIPKYKLPDKTKNQKNESDSAKC